MCVRTIGLIRIIADPALRQLAPLPVVDRVAIARAVEMCSVSELNECNFSKYSSLLYEKISRDKDMGVTDFARLDGRIARKKDR